MMTFATLIMSIGTYFFKFTNNFTFGGITGLAVLVAKTGVISAADFSFIANMLLLAVGAALTILYAVPILWAAATSFGFTT